MNWLNFFLSWCWCSQDSICPSFSLFSFGCFKCVFCSVFFVFCFGFERSKYNKFVFQKQIRFSVLHWSMKREVTQKIHWSEKDSTQSFFNWWMKKSTTNLNQTDANWWNQREARGGFVLVHFVLPLFNFESFDKKKPRCYDCLWHKNKFRAQIELKKRVFFLFFCLSSHLFSLFLHVKTTTTQPSKKSFSLFVLSVLSYFTTFVLTLCVLLFETSKLKKKKQNNLMTTLTDWHSWFYCCFLKNYHKKMNLTNVIFLWKGRMLFFGVFHCFRNKAPKHTISSVNGYVWVVKSITPIICIFEWNLKQNFCHNEN